MLSLDQIKSLPKVTLHDHLDGGLRPQTIIDHCAEVDHELPSEDAKILDDWFFETANSGNLTGYLSTFNHTVAAMQTKEHLRRVAKEYVLDQAVDGVVYAETRWAPQQHTQQGLSLDEAVEAVIEGLTEGMQAVANQGKMILVRQILTSLRHKEPNIEIAKLVVKYRDRGVCGFDLAGPETGFAPTLFLDSFNLLKRENTFFTIHAGEEEGCDSIWQALQLCGANRIGHGIRIVDDITQDNGHYHLGRLASYVLDAQIPLEICPTSNLQTKAIALKEHPIATLEKIGFNISVNCDNRLMSSTSLSQEFFKLQEQFGWTIAQIARSTMNAMNAAFCPYVPKIELLEHLILPSYDMYGLKL